MINILKAFASKVKGLFKGFKKPTVQTPTLEVPQVFSPTPNQIKKYQVAQQRAQDIVKFTKMTQMEQQEIMKQSKTIGQLEVPIEFIMSSEEYRQAMDMFERFFKKKDTLSEIINEDVNKMFGALTKSGGLDEGDLQDLYEEFKQSFESASLSEKYDFLTEHFSFSDNFKYETFKEGNFDAKKEQLMEYISYFKA